jgi:peptide chain release factor 3
MDKDPVYETNRRRTFAIISHPDAGKTTMTEKLLLYGGAIHLAGSVKSRKSTKYAVSDWMEIEKQRGISVTSSVLQFEYMDKVINILDTPGHQDFSEDTYRTLVAADSAVMLIDGAKGVEPQTIKLFHVCKLRGIPIFTFINKMDRASKHPFDLMQEIEDVLGIRSYPINWPVGTDGDFQGVYDRTKREMQLFGGGNHGQTFVESKYGSLEDPAVKNMLGDYYYDKLAGEIELLDVAGDAYSHTDVLKGSLTPVFFGSAMTNFGVGSFLSAFLEMAPSPASRGSNMGMVETAAPFFSGFIFKIQANMNKTHRDRIAFLRIVSGVFRRNMQVYIPDLGKYVKLSQPQSFMANDRELIEEAYPGDIIGLFDTGSYSLGMTLCEENNGLEYSEIPMFPSEHFARVHPKDSLKRKQFIKGISQLSEEGAIQVFRQSDTGVETVIVGVVGLLQLDVLEFRLLNEYNVALDIQRLSMTRSRWITALTGDIASLNLTSSTLRAKDKCGRDVLIFDSEWAVDWALSKNKGLGLADISV